MKELAILIMGTGIGIYLGYNIQQEKKEKKEDKKNVCKKRV